MKNSFIFEDWKINFKILQNLEDIGYSGEELEELDSILENADESKIIKIRNLVLLEKIKIVNKITTKECLNKNTLMLNIINAV